MRRPKLFTAIEAAAVVCVRRHDDFAALPSGGIARKPRDAAGCLLAAAAGWLAADFASGLVHWFADTFFEEDTPCIGPLLIQPFREHHRDPQAMTRHGFLELTGNSCLVLLPVVGAALALPLSPFLQAAVAAFAFGLFATNLFHKWAHDPAPPYLHPVAATALAHSPARASPPPPQRRPRRRLLRHHRLDQFSRRSLRRVQRAAPPAHLVASAGHSRRHREST